MRHLMPLALAAFFALGTFFYNTPFQRPAVQADEASHLLNAAAIAGFHNDAAGSYHAGYSLLISPVFWSGADPETVWKHVKIINSLLFAILFLGLWALRDFHKPGQTLTDRILNVVVVALYPMWVIMTGYTFSQLAFATCFVWSVVALMKSQGDQSESRHLLAFAAFALGCGFTYWIHPTGVAVIGAGFLASLLVSVRRGSPTTALLYAFLVCGTALLYKYTFVPWLHGRMSIGGPPSEHYPSILSTLKQFSDQAIILNALARTAGHFYYLLIGSAGLVWIAIWTVFRNLEHLTGKKSSSSHQMALCGFFAVAAVLGILALSVILFSTTPEANRMDHWMYGRYMEGALAPVLLLGITRMERKPLLWAIPLTALCALGLSSSYGTYHGTMESNIPALWQRSLFTSHSPLIWTVVGCGVIGIAAIAGPRAGKILIGCSFLCATILHDRWHRSSCAIAEVRSEPAKFVRSMTKAGEKVGYDWPWRDTLSHVHWFDSAYELYRNPLIRLTREQWVNSDVTYFLSFDPELSLRIPEIRLASPPVRTGLLTWAKGAFPPDVYPLTVAKPSLALISALGSGWHSLTPPLIWSSERADLRLPIVRRSQGKADIARIAFSVYSASPDRPLEVHWEFTDPQGQPVRLVRTYDSSDTQFVDIDLECAASSKLVTAVVPNAASPLELGRSQDARKLGIALFSIQLISSGTPK